MPGRLDEVLQDPTGAHRRAVRAASEEMAGVGHSGRPWLRQGRRSRMAARMVWRQGLLPLARIQGLQNARARAAVALPRLHALPGLPGQTVPAGGAALPIADGRFTMYAPGSR